MQAPDDPAAPADRANTRRRTAAMIAGVALLGLLAAVLHLSGALPPG